MMTLLFVMLGGPVLALAASIVTLSFPLFHERKAPAVQGIRSSD